MFDELQRIAAFRKFELMHGEAELDDFLGDSVAFANALDGMSGLDQFADERDQKFREREIGIADLKDARH